MRQVRAHRAPAGKPEEKLRSIRPGVRPVNAFSSFPPPYRPLSCGDSAKKSLTGEVRARKKSIGFFLNGRSYGEHVRGLPENQARVLAGGQPWRTGACPVHTEKGAAT